MKSLLKIPIMLLFLTSVVALATMGAGGETAVHATHLQGDAARDFLADAGILDQIMAEPYQAGNFGQPAMLSGAGYFGSPVAISGDTILVGARFTTIGGNNSQGAAYIFVRDGPDWVLQQQLVAGDGGSADSFGQAVALQGDTAVIGAGAQVNMVRHGAAYVFTRSGTTWTEQQKLVANELEGVNGFGASVALDGDTILVGASTTTIGSNNNQGAAYIFTRSGATWSEQQKLTAADGAALDNFGQSVAIEGDTAVVSAPGAAIGGTLIRGAAYIFTRSGATWTQQQKVFANDSLGFGGSLALSAERLLIGAPDTSVGGKQSQGTAYLFTGSGATWSQSQQLTASNGASQDRFGQTVGLSGDTLIIGAQGEGAYIFVHSGDAFSQRQQLTLSNGNPSSVYGYHVALAGDTAVVGDYLANRVYIFERTPPTDFLYLPLITRP